MAIRRTIVAMVLAFVLLASCLAAFAEGSNAGSEPTPEEAAFLDRLSATIDLTQYEQSGGSLYSDHELDEAVTEVEIDGTTLKLGMSFDEVIAAGFTAPEGFADAEGYERLSTSDAFLTGDGNKVDLGFSVSSDGEKLSSGVLDGIGRPYYGKGDLASVTINGISAGSDLSEVVEVMGEPAILGDSGDNLRMRYEYSDDAIIESITFYIGLDGKVTGLGLGGTYKK